MIRRLFMVPAAFLVLTTTGSGALAQSIQPLAQPAAPMPSPETIIPPPGENAYFPMRSDGQPFVLNIDETINWTEPLSHFYFNPSWRGEVWTPTPLYWIGERACMMLGTYPEYDQFSILRVGNSFHKFFEKYSGYGP